MTFTIAGLNESEGFRVVTINDVARVAGVSPATVSRVVNGKGKVGDACRARVQKIIQELGYKPNVSAQSLVNRHTTNVGLITPKISMEFFGNLAAGAEVSARDVGYSLLICNSLYEEESEIAAIESLHAKGCESIILHSDYLTDKQLIELSERYKGLVIINRYIPKIASRCVWFDNVASTAQIVDLLASKGHEAIAVATSIYQNRDPQQRLLGVRQGFMTQGLTFNDNLLVESTANLEGGKACAQELIQRGEPFTAVIAYNDLMAVGVIHELVKNGYKVPEQVSVVGFDDSAMCRACIPTITTIKYPIEEMAEYAVKLAIDLAKDAATPENKTHLFTSSMIERESVVEISHS